MSGLVVLSDEHCSTGEQLAEVLHATCSNSNMGWYAVRIKSRQEKVVSTRLSALRVPHFLPLYPEARQLSDRKQASNFPLFPGYIFIQIDPLSNVRLTILMRPGVVGVVGNAKGPLPIPYKEIESIRRLLQSGVPCSSQPLLNRRDHIRVIRGPLAGMLGTLIRVGSKCQLIISIQLIGRSVAVTVADSDLEHVAKGVAPSMSDN